MDIVTTALHALWQILVVGILLGAGLPTLFALGIRALNTPRSVVAPVTASNRASRRPSAVAIGAASLCFGLCVAAVLFGIAVIIYGKRIFGA